MSEQEKIKKIMIATPCYDGKLPIEYVGSLLDTLRAQLPMVIAPVFLPREAMLPHARNYLAQLFLESDFDSIFYIDSDMVWTPELFNTIASSEFPVFSGIARLKKEGAPFNFRELPGEQPKDNLLKVESIGCAFIKIDRVAFKSLMKKTYTINKNKYFSFFEYSNLKDEFVGEDITFSRKLRKAGYDIMVDLSVQVGHLGTKVY